MHLTTKYKDLFRHLSACKAFVLVPHWAVRWEGEKSQIQSLHLPMKILHPPPTPSSAWIVAKYIGKGQRSFIQPSSESIWYNIKSSPLDALPNQNGRFLKSSKQPLTPSLHFSPVSLKQTINFFWGGIGTRIDIFCFLKCRSPVRFLSVRLFLSCSNHIWNIPQTAACLGTDIYCAALVWIADKPSQLRRPAVKHLSCLYLTLLCAMLTPRCGLVSVCVWSLMPRVCTTAVCGYYVWLSVGPPYVYVTPHTPQVVGSLYQ